MITLKMELLVRLLDGMGYYKGIQMTTANDFLDLYNITLISNEDATYTLEFPTAKDETLFRLIYADLLV